MPCLDEETVLALADGRVAAKERAALDAHLDGCADCRALVEDVARWGAPETADDGRIRVGTEIGPYRVTRWLGSGATAAVYGAMDSRLKREVAIKVMHRGTPELLRAEAEALARLRHPNVLTVHEIGTFEGRAFLVTELVDGQSLREWIDAAAPPWRTVLARLLEAGAGLAAAHAADIVHRDIKPDNIVIARDGRAIVMDFGFAVLGDDAPTDVAGTPAYMAPEQRRGHADAASDQYGFAKVCLEVLRDAPASIVRVLERAADPEPSRRYADIEALLAAISVAMRRRRRRPRAVAAVVIVAVAGAVGFAVARGGSGPGDRSRVNGSATAAVRARAQLQLGSALHGANDPHGVELIRDATETAERIGADRLRGAGLLALSDVAMGRDDLETAQRHAEAALAVLPADAVERALAHNALGNIAYRSGQFDAALEHVTATIDIYAAANDPRTSRARFNAGSILQEQGRYEEALPVFLAARDEFAAGAGPDHVDTGRAWHSVGATYNALGRSEEAVAAYDEAVRILEAGFGPDHVDTLKAVFGRANALLSMERPEDALPLYERCVSALVGDRPPPLLVFCLDSQAKALTALGRTRDAGKAWRRAYGLAQSGHLSKLPIRATIPYELAILDHADGDRAGAIALMRDAKAATDGVEWDATQLRADIDAWLTAHAPAGDRR